MKEKFIHNILDVGCGITAIGDVNCDLYIKDFGHRLTGLSINKEFVKNFIQCDVQHLPFKDNSFNWVYCSHVIEHIPNFNLLAKEMVRVSSCRITVKCPHRLERMFPNVSPYHVNFFSCSKLKNIFNKLKVFSTVKISNFRCLPFGEYFNVFKIPIEITLDGIKTDNPILYDIISKLGTQNVYERVLKGDLKL